MKPTLSVLLPVYQAQATLGRLVGQLLEVLPDLTGAFEAIVIDDGSRDATSEVAHELSIGYPQLALATHPARLGAAASIRTGLLRTTGELVCIRDEDSPANPRDLCKLWPLAAAHEIVVGRCGSGNPLEWIQRLPGSMLRRVESRPAGLYLLHRRAVGHWSAMASDEPLLTYLQRTGRPIFEVDVRADRSVHFDPVSAGATRRSAIAVGSSGRVDRAASGSASLRKRPNFLAQLKAFAVGE